MNLLTLIIAYKIGIFAFSFINPHININNYCLNTRGQNILVRIYEMRQKEVINTLDGARYGYMSDVEIDNKTGKVEKLIIPGPGKILGMFGREQEYQIKWDKIKKIGDDIILVEIKEDEDILVSP